MKNRNKSNWHLINAAFFVLFSFMETACVSDGGNRLSDASNRHPPVLNPIITASGHYRTINGDMAVDNGPITVVSHPASNEFASAARHVPVENERMLESVAPAIMSAPAIPVKASNVQNIPPASTGAVSVPASVEPLKAPVISVTADASAAVKPPVSLVTPVTPLDSAKEVPASTSVVVGPPVNLQDSSSVPVVQLKQPTVEKPAVNTEAPSAASPEPSVIIVNSQAEPAETAPLVALDKSTAPDTTKSGNGLTTWFHHVFHKDSEQTTAKLPAETSTPAVNVEPSLTPAAQDKPATGLTHDAMDYIPAPVASGDINLSEPASASLADKPIVLHMPSADQTTNQLNAVVEDSGDAKATHLPSADITIPPAAAVLPPPFSIDKDGK